jgi:hypothetical protein
MKPPWKRVGVFQERHADQFELGKNVEIEMPCILNLYRNQDHRKTSNIPFGCNARTT